MNAIQKVARRKRRTRVEVKQLVAEFANCGMSRGEFCRTRGLSLSTLDRHLKRLGRQVPNRQKKPRSARGGLVQVELPAFQLTQPPVSSGVALVLTGGRRIEVQRNFDMRTFEQLLRSMETF
jgi:hypothetical protein